MKKLFIILSLLLCVYVVNAQRVYTITSDTLTEVETEYFTVPDITGTYESLGIQVLCTELGGTADGTVVLQGSLDGTTYVTLSDDENYIKGFTNDSLTISDGAANTWMIYNPGLVSYRIAATGTANDTTLVTTKYFLKK